MRKKSSARFESDQWRHAVCAVGGGGDRVVDLLERGEVDLARLLARGGVVHRPLATGLAPDALAADPVADRLQLGRDCCTHVCLLRRSFALAYRC